MFVVPRRCSKFTGRGYYQNGNQLGILGEQKANTRFPMIFNPSPALHKIRQFVRLIRRNPIPPRRARYAPWPVEDLPDPEQFVDSSVKKNTAGSDESGSHTRRKRASCPNRMGR